jgi:RNA polymerase sigma-70 factor (ECF subfamily)
MGIGEGDRFRDWMEEHLSVLHRIARAFAFGADQQDLLQELMLAVWRAAPAFRGESAPSTFIFRVAHNCALTWRRREVVRRHRQREFERLQPEHGEGVDPASTATTEALLDRLYGAIRTLEALDRSLMLLSLEGLSYSEIGEIHGLSETNVGARLTRARKKLAQKMELQDEF